MDQEKTGLLIRELRTKQHLTQCELAEKIGVSDKAISKWERGCGAPDVSLLPVLAESLKVDIQALLQGDLNENAHSSGNVKKIKVFLCPKCHNLVFSFEQAQISCCGEKLAPLIPKKAEDKDRLSVEPMDGEWYITADHEMSREHYVSFAAFLTGDTLIVRKLYPEWNMETRIPFFAHGTLWWYCTKHGLFYQNI